MTHADQIQIQLPDGPKTVADLLGDLRRFLPSDQALDQAALAYLDPSPAMVTGYAAWWELAGLFKTAMSPDELLEVITRSNEGVYGGLQAAAPTELADRIIEEFGAAARPWAEKMLSPEGRRCQGSFQDGPYRALFASAAAVLEPGPERGLGLVTWLSAPRAVRVLCQRASSAERLEWISGRLNPDHWGRPDNEDTWYNAAVQVAGVLPYLDLMLEPAPRALIERAVALMRRGPRYADTAAVVDGILATGQRYEPARPTAKATEARKSAESTLRALRQAGRMPSVAQGAAERAIHLEGGVPAELADRARWNTASEAIRTSIVHRLSQALGPDFTVERPADPMVTWIHRCGIRWVLIPGAEVVMGLSETEEKALRAAAPEGDPQEDWQLLFDELATMRPARKLGVHPLIVMERPLGVKSQAAMINPAAKKRVVPKKPEDGEVFSLATVVECLEKTPYRLLHECEWEYLAREGREGELTPEGRIPDAGFLKSRQMNVNGLGVAAMGLWPEVLTDGFSAGYEDAKGAPKLGEGPRVTRGGAAWIYPWQGCGEWQLLLSAVRGTTAQWDVSAAIRLAIGIR